MEKNHRHILLKTRLELVNDLDVNHISSYLYQEEILTEDDYESVTAEKTRKARAEFLLDTIPRKGPRAFGVFVKGLEVNDGSKHLAKMLRNLTGGEDTTDSPNVTSSNAEQRESVKSPAESCYKMTHKPCGICLIINNKEFLGQLSDRTGSDVDAKNLRDLFSSFNFTVMVVNNATGKQMKEKIEELASRDHSSTDCVVVCMLSHGVYGKIYASDCELLPISDVLKPLIMCEGKPELSEKPRLFFIQSCRIQEIKDINSQTTDDEKAKLNSFEVTVHSSKPDHSTSAAESVVSPSKLLVQEIETPSQANILISYSTIPGKEAWRNLETGSWFIDALVDVFKSCAAKQDVLSMLNMVNDAVSKRTSSISKVRQVPIIVGALTKKLFFKT